MTTKTTTASFYHFLFAGIALVVISPVFLPLIPLALCIIGAIHSFSFVLSNTPLGSQILAWWHEPGSSSTSSTKQDSFSRQYQSLKVVDTSLNGNNSNSNSNKKRPRRMSNGASSHMLLGSLPASKGKTNEIIHTILRIDSIQGLAKHLSDRNAQSVKENADDEDAETCIKIIKKRLFERIIAYDHFRSVPEVVSDPAFPFASKTEWKIAASSSLCNADRHVKVHNEMCEKDEINAFFETNLLNDELDMTKPLWDLHLFHSSDESPKITLILRTHHALADGLTLMFLISSLFSPSSSSSENNSLFKLTSPPAAFGAVKQNTENNKPITNTGEQSVVSKILSAPSNFWNSLKVVLSTAATKDPTSKIYDPEKFELSSRRSVLFLTPISTVKFNQLRQKLCKELNVERIPTNELLHALLSNAWSKCGGLLINNDKDGEMSPSSSASNKSSLGRFLIPFSPPIDPEILSCEKYRHELLPRNCVGFVSAQVSKGETLIDRIKDSMREWRNIKRSYQGHITLWMSENIVRYLPLRVKQAGCYDVATSHTLVFSNVAGPLLEKKGIEDSSTSALPFKISCDAAMANGMPQLICVGSMDNFSLTLTYNFRKFPETAKLNEYWEEELKVAGLM